MMANTHKIDFSSERNENRKVAIGTPCPHLERVSQDEVPAFERVLILAYFSVRVPIAVRTPSSLISKYQTL